VSVGDDRATVEVTAVLKAFHGDAIRFVLAAPPIDAETYFRFFDEIRFTDGADELPADRVAVGVYRVTPDAGEIHLSYRVHVGELEAFSNGSLRVPVVDDAGAVLPLRALLAVPETLDGEPVPMSSVQLVAHDGERPVHLPWAPERGVYTFSGRDADQVVRTAIAVTGDAFDADAGVEPIEARVVVRDGVAVPDSADASRVLARVGALLEQANRAFGTGTWTPVTVIVELGEGAQGVAGSGPFVHARVPAAYLEATPDELTVGGRAYDLYRELAHELNHAWIGTAGMVRPAGAEIFWMSEGVAEYLAFVALTRAGLATPETALESLAALISKLEALPDRGRPIDGDDAQYRADAAYRELILTKGPLVCFLLDLDLIESSKPITLDALLRFVLFRGSTARDRRVDGSLFADVTASVLGPVGRAAVITYTNGTIDAVLRERAAAAGIEWRDADGAVELSFAGSSRYRSRVSP